MLIINTTTARQLGRQNKIYLYINGSLRDELHPNEVKRYNLDPGNYEVVLKMNFYRSKPQLFEVTSNRETHAFEMKFREDWKYLLVLIAIALVIVFLDWNIRQVYSHIVGINAWANLFTVVAFVIMFLSNVRINKYRYLKLVRIDTK